MVPEVLEKCVDRALALRKEDSELTRIDRDSVRHPTDPADERATPVVLVVSDNEFLDAVQNLVVELR